ncbi:MAG TPA: hypothetical protein VMI06_02360 [Terriglobia bacterium]|nr:hypothetical protein [Terriglobia bacterium]
MSTKRGVLLIIAAAVFLTPRTGWCTEILDFGISGLNLGSLSATITSVTGSGGTGKSGTLSISSGSLSLSGGSFGGTLDITASGTIGAPLNISGTLLQASFTGATFSGSSLTLDNFSGTINSILAGYYGMGNSVDAGSLYISSSGFSLNPGLSVVATPEAGGLLVTLGVVLAGVMMLFAAARKRIIKVRPVS